MIFGSVAAMAAFDVFVIGSAVAMLVIANKHGGIQVYCGDMRGPLVILASVLLTAIYYVADLTAIFVLPPLLGRDTAHVVIEYLRLNIRWLITAAAVVLIVIGLTFVLLERRRVAGAFASIANRLVHCEEQERRRVASYLHDYVGQPLIALRLKLDATIDGAYGKSTSPEPIQFRKLLDETISRTRDLTSDLSPPVLHEEGLGSGVQYLCKKLSEECDVRFEYKVLGIQCDVGTEGAIMIFRICRELMLNVVKHAHTDFATVVLCWQDEALALEVKDNGVGYDSSDTALGFGLLSVRDRAAALGASIQTETQLGIGTQVTLTVPLHQSSICAIRLVE